ncbi:hypothetical protein, partial [Bathymodiolus thermophilus thioautotrophic gill symbiont]|uniref:hypothetical protein n=1 Tax=Bathymodiolus thermophilus thioautotrophic gill symbiont TaxID=2360 RepID=UPI0011163980
MENQEKTHKTWVWTSTENSREKQKLSVLAVVETIFFVLLTWFVAWYFDSYIHIVTAILIAPLLLLKTPKSIDEGIAAHRIFDWICHKPMLHNFL